MKTVFLLGNGFDLNVGLKTSYKDFYSFYLKNSGGSLAEFSFKKDLSLDINKWSDLEFTLGEYTDNIGTVEHLDTIHESLVDSLASYLEKEQERFTLDILDTIDAELFLSNIFQPASFLKARDKDSLLSYYHAFSKAQRLYSIVSFNYTHTVEKILGLESLVNSYPNLRIARNLDNYTHILDTIYHVHGSINEDMVLGVDSSQQISNSKLAENPEVQEQLIKSRCNFVMKHGVESKCVNLIEEADLICIFGSSLGKTDRFWWNLISEQLKKRNCRLIIFDYIPIFNVRRSHLHERDRTRILKRFFEEAEIESIKDKVYIAFNTPIFDLEIKC